MTPSERQLLSGNEAIALAALHSGVGLGTGYPGTPSTEILENFSALGGKAQWAPNEKVALEVGLGAAFGGSRVLVTMKHVGVNVAADPLLTATYMDVAGGLVLISADDPGLASSQNEQDNRYYSRMANIPTLEPADSQQAYGFMRTALTISERWQIPVMLRVTTRVCHSKTIVIPAAPETEVPSPQYSKDVRNRVMIPAFARIAHRKLRGKIAEIAQWAETCGLDRTFEGSGNKLGVVASGVSAMYAREADPEATVLQPGLTWPLPMNKIHDFAGKFERVVVAEEGDPCLFNSLRVEGIKIDARPEEFCFGELNVARLRKQFAGDGSPEPAPPKGKPPELCKGCPHRSSYSVIVDNGCIVAGDIGCYTLGVLPPFEAIDVCVCMGASIGAGLGLRHSLPEAEARRVISVIGDSTFMHSGVTGLIEMVYNTPPTGHVVVILDNGTTAMTGMQEHPGTGRKLDHTRAARVDYEMLAKSLGIDDVHVVDVVAEPERFNETLKASLANNEASVIIGKRPCILAAPKIRQYEKELAAECGGGCESDAK